MLTPEEFLGNMRTFGIRKEDRYDEPIIDDFIRSERCGICGEHPAVNSITYFWKRQNRKLGFLYFQNADKSPDLKK